MLDKQWQDHQAIHSCVKEDVTLHDFDAPTLSQEYIATRHDETDTHDCLQHDDQDVSQVKPACVAHTLFILMCQEHDSCQGIELDDAEDYLQATIGNVTVQDLVQAGFAFVLFILLLVHREAGCTISAIDTDQQADEHDQEAKDAKVSLMAVLNVRAEELDLTLEIACEEFDKSVGEVDVTESEMRHDYRLQACNDGKEDNETGQPLFPVGQNA